MTETLWLHADRMAVGLTRTERRGSLVYPALMSLGVGMLASCAAKPPPASTPTLAIGPPPALPPAPAPRRRMFPVPQRKPVPPPVAGAAPESADEAIAMTEPGAVGEPGAGGEPGAAMPAPQAAAPQARQLVGLDQPAATHLFGAASEQSSVPPATVWRYRNATCELDLFFYLDLRSGKMRTLHYKFKGGTADPAGQQDCLRSLVVARGS